MTKLEKIALGISLCELCLFALGLNAFKRNVNRKFREVTGYDSLDEFLKERK